jgi:hypothetical protein
MSVAEEKNDTGGENDPQIIAAGDRLTAVANALTEYVDTVVIIATIHSGSNKGTMVIDASAGNQLASFGAVRHWLIRQEQSSE